MKESIEQKADEEKEMFEIGVFQYWQKKLGIQVGMTREEALECFREWRADKQTCQRCEGTKYVSLW